MLDKGPEPTKTHVRLNSSRHADAFLGKSSNASAGNEVFPSRLTLNIDFADLELHQQGGLGIVCKAIDNKLNRTVAIKLMRERWADDPASIQQFAIEAEITSRLDHPGVVPVFVAGTSDDGKPFYAMRFIEGRDLAEEVDRFYEKPNPTFDSVDFRDLLQKLISVCKTIAYAHNRGIVHRDIKPQNIRVGRFGETIVLDWGLATVVDRSENFRDSGEATMILRSDTSNSSSSSSGVGTPSYMSPEQLSGLAATPASDIYSLGATLYKIVTGHSVVDDLPGPNTREALIEGRWKKPIEHQPSLPKQLSAIVERSMAHRPMDRYATAMELASDLECYLANAAVSCYTETPAEKLSRFIRKHQNWVRHAAVGLITLAVLSIGTAVYTTQLASSREQKRIEAEEQRAQASTAKEQANQSKRSSQLLSAKLAARSLAAEIELRGAILREEAASPTLRKLVADLNASPESPKERESLSNWLRDRYLARVTEALPTSSWCVYSQEGIQLARVAPRDSGDPNASLGKSYRHRDYFHAQGKDFAEGSPEALAATPHSFDVHVGAIFLSTNTKRLSVAFTVPIYAEEVDSLSRHTIGLLFASVQLNRCDILPNSILVDLRTDRLSGEERNGLVLRHPDVDEIEALAPNFPRLSPESVETIRRVKRSTALRDTLTQNSETGFVEYVDPVTNKATTAAVEQVFLANQEDHGEVGWVVLLRDPDSNEKSIAP